jgi:DNA-binding Lrp family transcriptional regulator
MPAPPAEKRDNRREPRLSKAERDERAAKALRLRNAQATFGQIADQLGISEQQARNDVGRAIREWVRVPAEQMVSRQQSVLMSILQTEYPDAVNRSLTPAQRHAAQDKILEVLRDERKLHGLDAPQKVTLGISEEEFARQAAELLQITGAAPLLALTRDAQSEAAELAGQAVIDAEVEEEEPWSNL